MEKLDKTFYRIGDVEALVGVPASVLRFWEKEFPDLNPKRNRGGLRLYTPADVELLRLIKYLVRDRGLRLEAARQQIAKNREDVARQAEVVDMLRNIRGQLAKWLTTLDRYRP